MAIIERDDRMFRLEAEKEPIVTNDDWRLVRNDLRALLVGVRKDLAEINVKLAALVAEMVVVRWLTSATLFGVLLLLIKAFLPHG